MGEYEAADDPRDAARRILMTQVHKDADEEVEPDTSHLDDVDDGCGCAEVWEHMSEQREATSD